MKKNIIVGLIFIVCFILVGYTGYYLGSKTIEPKVVETIVEKEPNIDEIKESVKTEIYEDAYNEGYEKGKTEVFELMLESENEEETVVEEVKPVENKETIKTEPTIENQTTQPTENQSSTQDNICPICGAVIVDEDHILSHGYTNDDGTNTIHAPTLSADSFTWSVSKDGMYTSSNFWTTAMSKLHYYDYDSNDCYATSGLGISVNPNGPGVYTIHWENSDGSLSCDQTVTLTE